MHTWVYKGSRKGNTYLYIREKNNFEQVPQSLLALLGDLSFVLDVELNSYSKLAQADIQEVLNQLENQGFYLQLPPSEGIKEKPC